MTTVSHRNTTEKREIALMVVVQVLAVLDAVVPPALGVWWVSTWPDRGGVVGLVAVLGLGAWGLRKLGRAVSSPEEYSWFVLKVGRWALILLVIGLIGKAWIALGR